MAKKTRTRKSRKQRRPNIPRYTAPTDSPQVQEEPVQAQTTTKPETSTPRRSVTTKTIDWATEYPYFLPDMKHLGVVVALMVILLLALNFIFIYLL